MKKSLFTLAACLTSALLFASTPSSGDAVPPGPSSPRPLHLPKVATSTLENGLKVETVADDRIPLVTLRLSLPAGSVYDGKGEEGTAQAVAATLTDGVPGMTSSQIASTVASLGGSLSASAAMDGATVSGSVLSENFSKFFDLFAKTCLDPAFPEKEVSIYRTNAIQKLKLARSEPEFLSYVRLTALLFGNNPYARFSATPGSLQSLTRARIVKFYEDHYTPRGSVLVIYGDVPAREAAALVRTAFGHWDTPAPAALAPVPLPARTGRTIALVERPGSVQARFDIGNLAPRATDSDYHAMTVANRILGGGAASRLFLDIREKHGYTYDPGSDYLTRRDYGIFEAGCDARNDAAIPALSGFFDNFHLLAATPPSPTELQNAKNFLNGLFALRLVTQAGVANQLVNIERLGLPADWLDRYRPGIDSVTPAQVQKAAKQFIDTNNPVVVLVGDPKLGEGLTKFGPVTYYDVDGKKVGK